MGVLVNFFSNGEAGNASKQANLRFYGAVEAS
jgi:hypothetical protein